MDVYLRSQRLEHPIKHIYGKDEIDLLELVRILWKQKGLILLVTLISTMVGFAYISFTKPVYEVRAYISSPNTADIDALNYGQSFPEGLLKPFEVKMVYNMFIEILLSKSIQHNFFNKFYLPDFSPASQHKFDQGMLYQQFQNSLTIKDIPRSMPTQYIVTATGHDADKLVEMVTQYVDLANYQAKEQILSAVNKRHQNILKELQQRIDSARETVKKRKLDRLVQLNEALKIAQATGLSEPIPALVSGVSDDQNKPSIMYSRGTKALIAEIENLNQRQSGSSFFPQLQQLEGEYYLYKKVTIEPEDFRMFRLNDAIEKPDFPVAPKKSLILVLSIITGLLCGIMIAIGRSLLLKPRKGF